MKRNPSRIIEILVWPSIEILLFSYLVISTDSGTSDASRITLQILLGIAYWNCTARIIQETVAQFIDDYVSKNIQNLIIAPISIAEIVVGVTLASLTKLTFSLLFLMIILLLVYPPFFSTLGLMTFIWVFHLELFGIALSLFALAFVLLLSVRASFVGWLLSSFVQIVSLVFYERTALPAFLQLASYLSPPSYVFEALRQGHGPLWQSSILIGIYGILGYIAIVISYTYSKKIGTLTKL